MIDLGSQKSPHYAQKLKMTQSNLELEGKMCSSLIGLFSLLIVINNSIKVEKETYGLKVWFPMI